MKRNTQLAWEQVLNPDILRTNLVLASLYLAYFEILKDVIVSRLKLYIAPGWPEDGALVSEEYRREGLVRNPSAVYASLSWLQEAGAIGASDLETYERVKSCRNDLAHKLRELIEGGIELRSFGKLG
jgi:hypothetical protein